MSWFEQVVLVSEDGRMIIERRYPTGEVEYWSVMTVAVQNGKQRGTAQVPFHIHLGVSAHDHKAEMPPDWATFRTLAFAKFDEALKAATPAAHQQIKDQVEQQARRQQSQILLANSLPHIPVQ